MESSTADFNSQGKITGAYNYDGGAGGVYLANDCGGFTMTGGRIFGNTVTSAASAGGVLCAGAGKLTVGGTAKISGNQKIVASGTTDSNVYLPENATIICSADTPLTMGASVGVTTKTAPISAGVPITTGSGADCSGFFSYDLVNSSNGYALASAVNTGSDAAQVVKLMTGVMTVDLDKGGEGSSPTTYNTFAQGWNEEVGTGNTARTAVQLNANWTAKSTNNSTDFGTGVGFGNGNSGSGSGGILVPSGKTITLDLNGKTINRALTQGVANGNVITVTETLSIEDTGGGDKITGGWNSTGGSRSGGGILVNGSGATLQLKGGSITGNKSIGGGAGVQINERSYFTMNGGKITGNVANYGNTAATDGFDNCGGVYAGGTFIMAGGEISGNYVCGGGTGNKGGGIFHDSNSFTVGGLGAAVVIRNNQSGCTFDASAGTVSGGITDNVYVLSRKKFILAWLVEGTYIGVTTEAAPAKDSPVEISHATDLDYHSLFHSDSENYKIGGKAYADGNYAVQLESTGNLVTITDGANGSGTTAKYGAGNAPIISDATGVPAGRTVTVTPAPSSGYELDKVTVTGTEAPHTEVTVTGNTFTMPDYPVTITVTYKASSALSGTKITTTLDLSNLTSMTGNVLYCTNDNVGSVIPGMTPHTHARGSYCWAWLKDDNRLDLYNVDIDTSGTPDSKGLNLPDSSVTVTFSGNNTVIASTDGIGIQSGSITLTGNESTATLTATGGSGSNGNGAGINALNSTVTITQGVVTATSTDNAGISGRLGVTISGGTVRATTASTTPYVAAIWSGNGDGSIKLSGGTVTAQAGAGAKPFKVKPTLSNGMAHRAGTGAWDNTEGTACVYEGDTAPTTHTVTVNLNGGNGSPSGAGSYAVGDTVTIKAGTRSGFSFNGWTASGVILATPSSNTTTFTMPANAVTVTANWSYNGGGSSSDGGYTAYPVSQPSGSGATGGTQTGGSVTLSSDKAKAGDTVTATPKPEKGYELTDLNVKNASGSLIETVKNADGTFSFKMPNSAVTVNTSFSKIQYYHDVSGSAYFADAAWYLRKENIMKGTGETTFSGGEKLSRQQSWMILSRVDGQAPPSMAAAKAWAVSANVSDGSNAGGIVSRQQLAVMLYRAAGSPAVTENKLKDFSDGSAVAAYAKDAMN